MPRKGTTWLDPLLFLPVFSGAGGRRSLQIRRRYELGVLAGLRSWALGAAWSLRHDYHWAELAHFAHPGVMHADHVAIV